MYSQGGDASKKNTLLANKLLKNTLPCLEPDEAEMPDLYTRALTAYALALAGRSNDSRSHLDWLVTRAQTNNSLLWWQKPGNFKIFGDPPIVSNFNLFYYRTGSGPALNVEMTSYVLLTLVKLGSNQDLLKARSIVRWLSKQRNSEGGFVSTQDTVVALQVNS